MGEKKSILEDKIKKLVQDYENATGNIVDAITINRIIAEGSNTRLIVQNIKTKLREGKQPVVT